MEINWASGYNFWSKIICLAICFWRCRRHLFFCKSSNVTCGLSTFRKNSAIWHSAIFSLYRKLKIFVSGRKFRPLVYHCFLLSNCGKPRLVTQVGLCHAQSINSLSHVDLLCFHCNSNVIHGHQWLPILTIVYFAQHNIKPETIKPTV